jgi:hypothetical protein
MVKTYAEIKPTKPAIVTPKSIIKTPYNLQNVAERDIK